MRDPRPIRIGIKRATGSLAVTLEGGLLQPRLVTRRRSAASVALVGAHALLLGGDEVTVEVDVGEGCALELEDISGMVAYDADGQRSAIDISVRVASGACLTWAAKPLVLADGSDVRRTLDLHLKGDAIALLRDAAVFGRVGEQGGRLRATTLITGPSGPLLAEGLHAEGRQHEPGILGGARLSDTAILVGRALPAPAHDEESALTRLVLDDAHDGGLVRHLGSRLHDSPLHRIWPRWQHDLLTSWHQR